VYLPRHRRRDMATSYLEVGVGVLACSLVLSGSSVAAGLGLGLFGVLSSDSSAASAPPRAGTCRSC
jgi:hypothetical protein